MGFKSDLEETIKLVFKIGQIWLKSASGKLWVRNGTDTQNATLVCNEVEMSGDGILINSDATNVGSDRSVRIQRSSNASSSYALVLPPNAGVTGNKVVLSAPGVLSFTEDSGDWNPGNQPANSFLCGPISGTATVPSFRLIAIQDLPTIAPNKGGTGLSSLGTPGQSIRVKADGSGFEFYTPSLAGSEEEEDMLGTIIYKDTNWGLYELSGQNFIWRSRDAQYLGSGGESATGRIEIGYVTLKSNLVLLLGGGGSTNGTLKRIKVVRDSDNSVLYDLSLNSLISIDTNGLVAASINTSANNGTKAKLRIEDNDSGGGWAWISIDVKSCFVIL